MRYGGQTPNLYTGSVAVTIPLYTYEDQDFTLPLSLHYASNGYIPNVQASELGLGWYLQAGGCITREVRGLPDENQHNTVKGYAYLTEEDSSNTPYDFATGKLLSREFRYVHACDGRDVETEPDIYTFNFLGHTGSFVWAGKKVYVFNANHPDGEYAVERQEDNSDIRITTGDGYKYTFAWKDLGTKSAVTYDAHGETTISKLYGSNDIWLLSEITAPNGRTISFEYVTDYMEQIRPGGKWEVVRIGGISGGGIDFYSILYKQQIAQLKSISIGGIAEVQFTYSDRLFPESGYVQQQLTSLATPKKLDTIRVVRKTAAGNAVDIKKCTFEYAYSNWNEDSEGNRIMFLRSVALSGEGTYRMQYHNADHKFPCHGTVSFDHWGYYNKSPRFILGLLRPSLQLNKANFAESTITGLEREPNAAYAMQGILTRISYPTGGYTAFEYEPHTYGYRMTRDRKSGNKPYMKQLPAIEEAGGVRIRKVTDHAADGVSTSRTYEYGGYGNLLHTPYYYYEEFRTDLTIPNLYPEIASIDVSDICVYHPNKTHIEYACVEEVFDDCSKIVYRFADYRFFPDLYQTRNATAPSPEYTVRDPELHNNFLCTPDYFPAFRGTLLSKSYYNSDAALEKETTWTYDTSNRTYRRYVESVKFASDLYYVYRTYLTSFPLIKTVVEDYPAPGKRIVSETAYQYNKRGQLKKRIRTGSDGIKTCVQTTYAHEIDGEPGSIYHSIRQRNMWSLPSALKKTAAYKVGNGYGSERTVGTENFTYAALRDTTVIRPAYHYKSVLGTSVREKWYTYDSMGRVTQAVDKNGLSTIYVWGYGHRYPLAEITGSSLGTVMAITALDLPYSTTLPDATETKLRNIPFALVTTYRYDPLIGITRITDPAGRKRVFTYTPSGKLSGEYDDQGNCIRSYLYSNDLN